MFLAMAILHRYIWFSFHRLAIARNMPTSFTRLILSHVYTYAILLTPEFIVLLRHYPLNLNFMDVSGVLVFGMGVVFLMYSLMLVKQVELSKAITYIFWLVVLTTFIILFFIHPLVLGFFFFFLSLTIIYLRHDKFEYIEKIH